MANIKIPALTELTSIADADKFVVEDNSASQTKFARADTIVDSGSNVNGWWVRYYDGTQICRNVITAPYQSALECYATWTFPKAFITTSYSLQVQLNGSGSSFTPEHSEVTTLMVLPTKTDARVNAQRIPGHTDMVSGDTAELLVLAVGRWY